jgi:hypothetical protein
MIGAFLDIDIITILQVCHIPAALEGGENEED